MVEVANLNDLGLGWRWELVSLLIDGGAAGGGVGSIIELEMAVGRNSTVAGPPLTTAVIGVRGRRGNTPPTSRMVGGDYGSCGAGG